MASLTTKGTPPRAIGRTKGGLNSKRHVVSDGRGPPLTLFLSPGQMSDARGELVLLVDLPAAKRLLSDQGYDGHWLLDEMKARSRHGYISGRRGRLHPARHNRRLRKQRYRIENAFARPKDWREIDMPLTPAVAAWASPPLSSFGRHQESRP